MFLGQEGEGEEDGEQETGRHEGCPQGDGGVPTRLRPAADANFWCVPQKHYILSDFFGCTFWRSSADAVPYARTLRWAIFSRHLVLLWLYGSECPAFHCGIRMIDTHGRLSVTP
jgi:hypothetical protein